MLGRPPAPLFCRDRDSYHDLRGNHTKGRELALADAEPAAVERERALHLCGVIW
jgi:hypothetical protein